MAGRAQPVSSLPGRVAAAAVAALIALCLGAVVWRAEAGAALGPADFAAIRFTALQATLSAGLSVALAIPVARALARRSFFGRRALITLLGAPFILPVIVAVLGLLTVFGRGGWLSGLLGVFGLPPVQIYGLHGVVLAHVFFNLPLATRLILQGWQDIPAERFRLAAQLGCETGDIWRLLERPMLARVAPGALAIVFAICLTSFAVALTLGGGPKATTVELAIYQAFMFEFDLGKAALLSCLQVLMAIGAALLALRLSRGDGFGGGLDRPIARWDAQGLGLRLLDGAVIAGVSAFLLLPLSALVMAGLGGLMVLPVSVYLAAVTSIGVAATSTVILLVLALPMAAAVAAGGGLRVEMAGLLALAVSPLVIGTGLFVVTNPWIDPATLALPLTALVNALMALPFALRILIPRAREVVQDHRRLGLALNMQGGPFFRLVLLPRLRPQIGFAAGLAAALSIGDLGVIALFANQDWVTLPLQMYRLMGAYQMEAAAGAALILLAMSLLAFWLLDRGGRRHVAA